MRQILTPEEMAALFEGLREAEGEPDCPYCDLPEEILSRDRGLPERCRIPRFQGFSTWLMALADLRWPHL